MFGQELQGIVEWDLVPHDPPSMSIKNNFGLDHIEDCFEKMFAVKDSMIVEHAVTFESLQWRRVSSSAERKCTESRP